MMPVSARIVDPQDVQIEVTINLTVQQWDKICTKIQDEWPGVDIARQIKDVIYKIKRDAYLEA